jgi:hypothetical protein
MNILAKILSVIIAILLLTTYWFINSSYFGMTELDYLTKRIKFGRLEYHKIIDIKVEDIEVHNRQKIFTINFKNEQIFAGDMEHFLIFAQGRASILD